MEKTKKIVECLGKECGLFATRGFNLVEKHAVFIDLEASDDVELVEGRVERIVDVCCDEEAVAVDAAGIIVA